LGVGVTDVSLLKSATRVNPYPTAGERDAWLSKRAGQSILRLPIKQLSLRTPVNLAKGLAQFRQENWKSFEPRSHGGAEKFGILRSMAALAVIAQLKRHGPGGHATADIVTAAQACKVFTPSTYYQRPNNVAAAGILLALILPLIAMRRQFRGSNQV
jgi:hypothetical protein